MSGESRGGSGAGLLAKAEILNTLCVRSLEPARARVVGGGGNTGFEPGSGEDLYVCAGDTREAGVIPEAGSSTAIIEER